MFLSKAAITKQLFYEFLDFKKLALAPGKQAELTTGSLLGSGSQTDIATSIQNADTRLMRELCQPTVRTSQEQQQFKDLLTSLINYKRASSAVDNPFSEYIEAEPTIAHPCGWLVFAPLLMQPLNSDVSYKTEDNLRDYLKNPKVGFTFDTTAPIETTGLFIAVRTNNHEMVNAFLCTEFSGYQLTKPDLVKLLKLTDEPQTRLALFRHSGLLIKWIRTDEYLQKECVKSFEELLGLWACLNDDQRGEFINQTNSQLWLSLLDKDLGKQKIERLLGNDFNLLTTKLNEEEIEGKISPDTLTNKLLFLNSKQQFEYLLSSKDKINRLFPIPHDKQWINLLQSLGYQINDRGRLKTTRYILPEAIAKTHDNLIAALVTLPLDAGLIINALQKIDAFVDDPRTQKDFSDFLNTTAQYAVENEYKTSFVANWVYRLLRYLNIMSQSPLHPYLDRLTQAMTNPELLVPVLSGTLMTSLPEQQDYRVYNQAIECYFADDIKGFWSHLPEDDRKRIVEEPLRFSGLIDFLNQSNPDELAFFLNEGLDEFSLKHFNTLAGLRQLVLETPTFNASIHLPLLINAMKQYDINFLDDTQSVAQFMSESEEAVFNQVKEFLPFNSSTENDEVLVAQARVLESLQKEHFNRFLQAYCMDAHHFSALLLHINITNPLLVENCWGDISESIWKQWYKDLNYAEEWSQTLTHLSLSIRLEFFEKLTSDGTLDPEEFCDFLLNKEEDVINTLWRNVPKDQWNAWITEKKLPETTVSLLETMPYPLRIHFLQEMLKMNTKDLESLCVIPNQTIEQFYPNEVKTELAHVDRASTVKERLVKLKGNKHDEFNQSFENLDKALYELTTQLQSVRSSGIEKHNQYDTYFTSWFEKDPYYGHVALCKSSELTVRQLYNQLTSHPLFKLLQDEDKTKEACSKFRSMLTTIQDHLNYFNENSNVMDSSFKPVFLQVKDTINNIQTSKLVPEAVAKHTNSRALAVDVLIEQARILLALPRPLEKEVVNHFVKEYCSDPHHFSALLVHINNYNPLLVSQCWNSISDSIWTDWYKDREHAASWAMVVTHLEPVDRLNFFELLTSNNTLDAEVFCDFLINNEAAFSVIWSSIPADQWSAWIKQKELPETTVSLLNTMAYPLRVKFLKDMVHMKKPDLDSLCVIANKTINEFYPNEVVQRLATVETVNQAKEQLTQLKQAKAEEFDQDLSDFDKELKKLNTQLQTVYSHDIKKHNQVSTHLVSFFSADPYYDHVRACKSSADRVRTCYSQLTSHPLFSLQTSKEWAQFSSVLTEIKKHLTAFNEHLTQMDSYFTPVFSDVKTIMEKIEGDKHIDELGDGLDPSIEENKIINA